MIYLFENELKVLFYFKKFPFNFVLLRKKKNNDKWISVVDLAAIKQFNGLYFRWPQCLSSYNYWCIWKTKHWISFFRKEKSPHMGSKEKLLIGIQSFPPFMPFKNLYFATHHMRPHRPAFRLIQIQKLVNWTHAAWM